MSDPRFIYTITASGERFTLTKDQIESDPGNYFASYFFGEFSEASSGTRELVVEKEPKIFKLIQAHLRGYTVLPLTDQIVPDYMTKEAMVINLLKEAEFYALDLFCQKIHEYQQSIPKIPPTKYKFAHWTKARRWILSDIAKRAFEMHLQHFRDSKHEPFIPQTLTYPDEFMVYAAWDGGDQAWALLESIEKEPLKEK